MDLGLAGRTAIVTGAGGAIGAATAATLAAEGANVVAADINLEAARAMTIAQDVAGSRVLPAELDVSVEESWRVTVQRTVETFGRVDILVNNAGLNSVADAVDETVDGF